MKKLTDFLFSDKMYFMLVALSGAYFVHKGNYPMAYMELVLVMVLLKPKKEKNEKEWWDNFMYGSFVGIFAGISMGFLMWG